MSGEKVNAQEAIDTNSADSKTDDIPEPKENLVEDLEKALDIIKHAPVHNKETFINLRQQLDNFLSSLKDLPVGTSFKDVPTEIKTQILNYLCDDGAFVAASVSKEWKAILREKIVLMENVTIGRHCKNGKWWNNKCFNPTEMLKASLALEMNVPLVLCHEVQDVDSQLLVKALTNVSKFTLDDTCDCWEYDFFLDIKEKPLLSNKQGEDLMKALEMKSEPMEEVVLKGVDLTHLKDRLISCLLKKVKTLTLSQDRRGKGLNFSSLVRKLRQNSAGRKLERLNLYFQYNRRLSVELLVDGLSTVNTIDLGEDFAMDELLAKRLISKMSTEVTTKTMFIRKSMLWGILITPLELRMVLERMDKVQLEGVFLQEQVEVARALPGGYAVHRSNNVFSIGKN